MASITASRFALLNVDDEYDSDENQKKGKQNAKQAGQQPNQAKKKNKKKKKLEQQKENEELRGLAFAKGGSGKGKGQGAGGTGPSMAVLSSSQRSSEDRPDQKEKQWDTWKKADKELTADAYEKDLEQALLASKLEFEEHKQVKAVVGEENGKGPHKGKKKKKDKPAPMSLEEFQQNPDVVKPDENGAHGDGFEEEKPKPTTSIAEPDPKFFDNVHKDAQKVIRKEQIQEEYRKQYVVENARTQQYQDDIEKRDARIKKLRDKNIKLEGELKEVKERNKQLCHILAQGEMKGKTTVLMELNELKQVRDELTEEVSNLTSELEKERSKNHALKSAADKHDKSKGGKHSK